MFKIELLNNYKNAGQNAEQSLAYALTGEIRKHDKVAFDKGSDIPEFKMSVKSARFTLASTLNGESYEEMQADFFSWASRDDTLGLKKTVSEEEWDIIRTKINSQMAVINNDINQATQNLKNGLQSYLTTLELQNADFAHIEEDTWKQVSTFISTMTAD